jgi:Family of unknown function (DUF6847)
MKLAEALILRADAQKRIAQLRDRLVNCAKVQEGEQPPEDPASLIAELERISDDLLALMQKINATNAKLELEKGVTIADALATRDLLMLKRGAYQSLAEAASQTNYRYSRSEVKYLSTVNVAEIQRRMDDLSKQHRELDARIQAANWNIDLIE